MVWAFFCGMAVGLFVGLAVHLELDLTLNFLPHPDDQSRFANMVRWLIPIIGVLSVFNTIALIVQFARM